MAVTVTCTGVDVLPDGYVIVKFSDGFNLEFMSIADVQRAVNEIDDPQNGIDLARMMDLAYLLARQPDLTPDNVIKDKDFTLDLSAPQPIKVQ